MDFYLCHGTVDIMSIDNSSTVRSKPEHCRSDYGAFYRCGQGGDALL